MCWYALASLWEFADDVSGRSADEVALSLAPVVVGGAVGGRSVRCLRQLYAHETGTTFVQYVYSGWNVCVGLGTDSALPATQIVEYVFGGCKKSTVFVL